MKTQFLIDYWSQLTVILGVISYFFKSVFDYSLKSRELKFKYFYELRAKKIVEVYSKIVEIQMIIDRRKKGDSSTFEENIFKHRIELDEYYWESSFYLRPSSEKSVRFPKVRPFKS